VSENRFVVPSIKRCEKSVVNIVTWTDIERYCVERADNLLWSNFGKREDENSSDQKLHQNAQREKELQQNERARTD